MSILGIGGLGMNLTLPPSTFNNNPVSGTNRFALPAGSYISIPAGVWWIHPGPYAVLQFNDPVTGGWLRYTSVNDVTGTYINSDGDNFRVANLTGCPVGAFITNVGSGYVQSTTVVTASAGGSTWQPIIGGAINSTVTITSGGSGFTTGYQPSLYISPPAAGGVQATGTVTTSGGAINAVTITNQGAGYTFNPAILVVPNPFDPNIGSIVNPVLTLGALTGAGTLTGLLMLTPGVPQTAVPTLAVSGAGSSAAATAVMAWTITAVTVGTAGVAVPGTIVQINSVGGLVAGTAGAVINPLIGQNIIIPRPANIYAPVSAGAVGTPVILDGGLFEAAPTPMITSATTTSALAATTAPAATFAMGGTVAYVVMQPV